MAQAQRSSAAVLFGIRDNPWLAFQFDNAVMTFGTWAQNRISAVDEKGKSKYRTLEAALDLPGKVKPINIAKMAMLGGVNLK